MKLGLGSSDETGDFGKAFCNGMTGYFNAGCLEPSVRIEWLPVLLSGTETHHTRYAPSFQHGMRSHRLRQTHSSEWHVARRAGDRPAHFFGHINLIGIGSNTSTRGARIGRRYKSTQATRQTRERYENQSQPRCGEAEHRFREQETLPVVDLRKST